MRPRFFMIPAWETNTTAESDVLSFNVAGRLPDGFSGPLSFHTGHLATRWFDVLPTRIGILLFAERVASALEERKLRGVRFCPANITNVENARLRQKALPRFRWLNPIDMIKLNCESFSSNERRRVPSDIDGKDEDIYRCDTPGGPIGYACSLEFVEACRELKVKNIRVVPLDYFEPPYPKGPVGPPFRIDIAARQWPPDKWYPDGFKPHPQNVIED